MRDNTSNPADDTYTPQNVTGAPVPDIDVIIAVHTTSRPLGRAIQSCVGEPSGPIVRVTVVCHNISRRDIQQALEPVTGLELRFLELSDGTNSPAGPKNTGLDVATAAYVCMLDSDDYLEPGALLNWYQNMVTEKADIVVAPVRHESGSIIKTPRARFGRCAGLDPVKDGLAYATAMRGLWRTDIGGGNGFRYVSGLRTGEDLAPGLQAYFSGARLVFPRNGPAYVLGNEADDRVTADVLPLAEEFRAVLTLPEVWLAGLSSQQALSVAAKIARTSLISAVVRRGAKHHWDELELAAVQEVGEFLDSLAPGYRRVLTVRDARLLRNALTATSDAGHFKTAVKNHQQAGLPSKMLSSNVLANFSTESHLRHSLRALLDRRS